MKSETARIAYTAAEVEAITRFVLRDLPIRVSSGDWWGYSPTASIVTYPRFVLEVWPGERVVGAICHEVAEALFSGPAAEAVVQEFVRRAARLGCPDSSALLLLNAVNDLRVNRLYLAAYPGSDPFLRAVYTTEAGLERKDDRPIRPGGPALPHHLFIDALTRRWAQQTWRLPDSAEAVPDRSPAGDAVRSAMRTCWSAVRQAVEAEEMAELAERVAANVLPTYVELIRLGDELIAEAERRAAEDEAEVPEPPSDDESDSSEDGDEVADDDQFAVPEEPVEAWIMLDDEGESASKDEESRGRPPGTPTVAKPGEDGKGQPGASRETGTPAWQLGVIPRFRRMRSRRSVVDYEKFDYIAAVRRLEPQIRAIIDGRDGRPGLAAILTMRRFGTLDPWRRPRRFRRGDTGDIDSDHPENLLVDPAVAFLKGIRQRRDESQKDFANVILLDISGSIVQYGYPSRKFDQLVDTMVVFCEVHERLKLPYQLMCFSDHPTILRSFAECRYESLYLDPTSAYVVKDFSDLVRRMYLLEHTDTLDAPALRQALADALQQRGLKTILVVTDGISSDRPELWATLGEIEARNELVSAGERLQVLAFGVGLAEQEFRASYEPVLNGRRLQCSRGRPVRDFNLLPSIVCDVVEERIRTA